jgi:hypothetical protein
MTGLVFCAALACAAPFALGARAAPAFAAPPPRAAVAGTLLVGDTFGTAVEVGFRVTFFVIAAIADLQDAWSNYVEGFRKRHPAPRPKPLRPDSTHVAPRVTPRDAPPPVAPAPDPAPVES